MASLSGDQILAMVGMAFISIVALLGWIIKLMMPWMQKLIDKKNGEISKLVAANCELTETVLAQVRQGQALQDQRLEEMQRNCQAHTLELARLVKTIEERAA
jgi:hypothetical protein